MTGKLLPVVYGFAIVVTVIFVLDFASKDSARGKSVAMELANTKRELSRCASDLAVAKRADTVMDALSGQEGD